MKTKRMDFTGHVSGVIHQFAECVYMISDFRLALRSLLKNPGFTLVAAVSLAIGIGLNSAVFSIINAIFFQTVRGVGDPSRIAFFNERFSYPAFEYLRQNTRSFSDITAARGINLRIRYEDTVFRDVVPAVSDNYFAVFGIQPFAGRFFTPGATSRPAPEAAAILDYVFWKRHLNGAPDVVGREIVLDRSTFTIAGIAPESFHGPGPERPPLWISLGMLPQLESREIDWSDLADRSLAIFGRLHKRENLAEARAEVKLMIDQRADLFPEKRVIVSVGREEWTGEASPEKQVEFLLVTVVPLVVVGAILWIACSNVANLLLARAVKRQREIAIRLAAGASRWRVVRLLLAEALTLAVLGGVLGLVVGSWTVDFVLATFSQFSDLSITLDARVLVYCGGISLFSAVLFGLVPAIQATRTDIAPVLKGEDMGVIASFRGSRLRTFFLVTQIASSIALLVVMASFVRTLIGTRFSAQAEEINQLLMSELDLSEVESSQRATLLQETKDRVMRVPGTSVIAFSQGDVVSHVQRFRGEAFSSSNAVEVVALAIEPDFFRTVGYRLERGRIFEATRNEFSSREMVINQAASKALISDADVLGLRMALSDEPEAEIVGIITDHDTKPRVYRPLTASQALTVRMFVRTQSSARPLAGAVQKAVAGALPADAYPSVAAVSELYLKPLADMTRISLVVGSLALALAAAGLYGSVSFVTSQRTREIGIRYALGAKKADVLWLVVRQAGRISGIGFLLGIGAIWIAFQFMSGLIFGKWTLDLFVLGGVSGIFATTVLIACLVPARRASRVNPVEALRCE